MNFAAVTPSLLKQTGAIANRL